MKKIIKGILNFVFGNLFTLIGLKRSISFLELLLSTMQHSTKTFITYHQRPIKTNSIQTKSQLEPDLPQLAIIIQGPIMTKHEFTFETIKLYKQHFPNAIIILSTWGDEPKEALTKIEKLEIIILLNTKPQYAGISHINYQIVSSKEGIKKAKKLGAEYVIKTRTDQRMYATNIEQFLFNILNTFPLNASVKKQKKRLIGLSLNTFKYRMYGMSDMFTYGHIDDMLLYWDIPLDTREFNEKDKEKARMSLRNFAEWRVCEVFLTTEFLKNIEKPIKWTLRDSWGVFADHFCIIDKESLGMFWNKYGLEEYRWKKYDKSINIFEEMNFENWLNIYNIKNENDVREEILDYSLNNQPANSN